MWKFILLIFFTSCTVPAVTPTVNVMDIIGISFGILVILVFYITIWIDRWKNKKKYGNN